MGFFKETRIRLDSLERRIWKIERLPHRPPTGNSEVLEALRSGIVRACASGDVGTAAIVIKALDEIDRARGVNLLGAIVFGPSGERCAEQNAGDGEGAADQGSE